MPATCALLAIEQIVEQRMHSCAGPAPTHRRDGRAPGSVPRESMSPLSTSKPGHRVTASTIAKTLKEQDVKPVPDRPPHGVRSSRPTGTGSTAGIMDLSDPGKQLGVPDLSWGRAEACTDA